jgi:xanthosine utilization system XapX-like protein
MEPFAGCAWSVLGELLGGGTIVADDGRVRRALRMKLPADSTLAGVGAAGSLVGERVFVAGQVVCSNHHQKPNMGKPYQSQGSWCADVDACCDDLMGRVERELGANQ